MREKEGKMQKDEVVIEDRAKVLSVLPQPPAAQHSHGLSRLRVSCLIDPSSQSAPPPVSTSASQLVHRSNLRRIFALSTVNPILSLRHLLPSHGYQ